MGQHVLYTIRIKSLKTYYQAAMTSCSPPIGHADPLVSLIPLVPLVPLMPQSVVMVSS